MSELWASILRAVGVGFGVLFCLEAGYWFRKRSKHPDASHPVLQGAVFALLGLLFSFSFSNAEARFDDRRIQVLKEVNQLASCERYAELLPGAQRLEVRQALARYADLRVEFGNRFHMSEDVRPVEQDTAEAERDLWRAVAPPDGAPPPPILGQLDTLFSTANTRTVAAQTSIQPLVVTTLIGLTLIASLLAGRNGITRSSADRVAFAIVVAVTYFAIADLADARTGVAHTQGTTELFEEIRDRLRDERPPRNGIERTP